MWYGDKVEVDQLSEPFIQERTICFCVSALFSCIFFLYQSTINVNVPVYTKYNIIRAEWVIHCTIKVWIDSVRLKNKISYCHCIRENMAWAWGGFNEIAFLVSFNQFQVCRCPLYNQIHSADITFFLIKWKLQLIYIANIIKIFSRLAPNISILELERWYISCGESFE